VALTSPLALYWWGMIAAGSGAFDWRIFVEAGHRAWAGSPDLYQVTDLYSFRHSPLMALAMPAIASIGVLGVRAVIVVAALTMPTWPMRLLALTSWPFAMDLQNGALVTVLVATAAWALRGSRWAGVAFLVLTVISPRPLMLPIAAYLLWQRRDLRIPAVAIFIVHSVGVLATGYADDWLRMLFSVGTDGVGSYFNLSPSRFIGTWWLPIGTVLAVWLTYRGHVGWAALAVNPYVLPHYVLFALLELDPSRPEQAPSHRRGEFGRTVEPIRAR
jgi:hypothetical protein